MRCAVLGDPIAHSLSPALHRAGYAALGLDWTYEAVQVASGGLPRFLAEAAVGARAGAEAAAWRGLSLTMPLKREVMALGDEVSDRARGAGAANTVVFDGGRLLLDNTDLPGAVAAVRERFDAPLRSATVLGAGATAASLGLALCELGVRTLRVLARDEARSRETLEVIAGHPTAPDVRWGPLAGLGTSEPLTTLTDDVVVSTVPAGAQDAALVGACRDVPLVFEALYDPWPTPLAAAALARGQTLVGGLDLLVHQAALQFALFTGEAAPLAAMRAAGEAALRARTTS